MPKVTFFNLPEEKQEILIEAAKKEFSRVSLHEASISNIIKAADIPRGSFYQYFDDKDDAFFYVLELHGNIGIRRFIACLKDSDGDIFETAALMYKSMLKNFRSQENRDFFRNAFLNMSYKVERTFTKNFSKEKLKNLMEIRQLLDTSDLDIESKGDVFHIVQIIIAVMFHNLVLSFAKELTDNEAMDKFMVEVKLLKRGLCKQS